MFTTVRDFLGAHGALPQENDADVVDAVAILQADSREVDGLGFFHRRDSLDPIAVASRILAERGKNVTEGQLAKVMAQLKLLDDMRAARRRFWIQSGLSALLLIAATYLLHTQDQSQEVQKGTFALIGTIVGYWLR